MNRLLLVVPVAAALLAATAAHAGGVSWSVGVSVPPVIVSSGPAWAPAPVRVVPGAVVYSTPAYAPAPIVYDEPYVAPYVAPYPGYWGAPVVVAPRHRYWGPPRTWAPVPRGPWHRHGHWRH